jgi:hypothetical protein
MEIRVKNYMKRPFVIQAYQYRGEKKEETPDWVQVALVYLNKNFDGGIVSTLEGNMNFHIFDYLVKGIRGEVYVVAKDIFEESYYEV